MSIFCDLHSAVLIPFMSKVGKQLWSFVYTSCLSNIFDYVSGRRTRHSSELQTYFDTISPDVCLICFYTENPCQLWHECLKMVWFFQVQSFSFFQSRCHECEAFKIQRMYHSLNMYAVCSQLKPYKQVIEVTHCLCINSQITVCSENEGWTSSSF